MLRAGLLVVALATLAAWGGDGAGGGGAADTATSSAGVTFEGETLCLIGVEQGSRPTQLIGTRPKESSPRWSADGKQIAFARFPGGVFLYDLETKRTMRVPLAGETFSLSWGPA